MMNNNEIDDDNEPIMINLETAEKILAIRDFIEKKDGRRLGFRETIHYAIEEVVDRKNILDELHNMKKKKNK